MSIRTLLSSVIGAFVAMNLAGADGGVPHPVLPDTVEWSSPPGNPDVRGAWMVGSQDSPGIYAFRVKITEGARIPPHTHPDMRFTTVLSGTLYVGFGDEVVDADMVPVPIGAVYIAPAGQAHYLWARDGDVEYQESGVGPTAVVPAR